MTQIENQPRTTSTVAEAGRAATEVRRVPSAVTWWQLGLLRIGYLVMGVGLVIVKWPLFFQHRTWGLAAGTVQCLLVGMSLLALLGVRYPVRMLPILLFEVTWKVLWLAVFALPLWLRNDLHGDALEQTTAVLGVVLIIAVIPWRYALAEYVMAPGDAWRPRRRAAAERRPS